MSITTKLHTAEELWVMPTDEPWEIWEGELREVPGAGGRASNLAGVIFALLLPTVRGGDLGLLTTADGTYVVVRDPDTVLVPDVGFVRWDRLPGRIAPERYIPAPPDLAVEVVSPTDEPGKMAKKRDLYRRAGVALQWWVDPARRTVAVYRDGVLAAEPGEGGKLDGGDVLPGLRVPVSEIFA